MIGGRRLHKHWFGGSRRKLISMAERPAREAVMPKSDFTDAANKITVTIDGDEGDVMAGGNGQDGSLRLRMKDGKEAAYIAVTATGGSIMLSKSDGKQSFFVGSAGDCAIGGNGVSGDLRLFAPTSLAGGAAVLAGQ